MSRWISPFRSLWGPGLDVRLPWLVVRFLWRGFECPQWPYFSRRYCIASFGGGPFGVMLMHYYRPSRVAFTPTPEERQP